MKNIIQQTIEIISIGFEKNIKNLLEQGKDISQFVLETQKDLHTVGVRLVKDPSIKYDYFDDYGGCSAYKGIFYILFFPF